MTAVGFEMKPSWYKDPAWIFRDATLLPGFWVAVNVLRAAGPCQSFLWV